MGMSSAGRSTAFAGVLSAVVLSACGAVAAQPDQARQALKYDHIQTLLASMTLKQKIGQMMMVSFAGPSLSSQAKSMINQIRPGGITLFGDNFSSPSQLTALDVAAQKASHIPLIISVDQEGGEVIRITSGAPQMQSEYAYGRQNKPGQLRRDAAAEARALRKLGINMNLAPVLDVATQNSVIGMYDRSYGPNASVDTALGLAAIKGYQSHGIAATAKHVVGLGTTTVDPESVLPHLNLSAGQLSNQLAPFKAAAKAGVDGIMVTHVVLSGVTSPNTPASLSRKVVTGILRQQFAYKGLIMTDSLTMGAVTSHFGLAKACQMAVGAGEDVLLIAAGGATETNEYRQCENAVVSYVSAGKVGMTQINASVRRILTLKHHLGLSLPNS